MDGASGDAAAGGNQPPVPGPSATFSIQPPEPFDFTKPHEWEKWIKRFERFPQATDLYASSQDNQKIFRAVTEILRGGVSITLYSHWFCTIRMMMMMMTMMMMMMIFPVSVSGFPVITTDLNHNTTLPCRGQCSGLVKWTEFSSGVPVAKCDQTSCTSLREGFMMSHDQYLTGDWSLGITGADYRKWNLYTCNCDGTDLCDVSLRIKHSEFSVQEKAGGSLTFYIPITETVRVEFKRSDGVSTTIWENSYHQPKLHDDYKDRLFFNSSLHLDHLKSSDSGVYTVWDTVDDDLISTYNLTVTEQEQNSQFGIPWWVIFLVVGVLIFISVVLKICVFKKKNAPMTPKNNMYKNPEELNALNVDNNQV